VCERETDYIHYKGIFTTVRVRLTLTLTGVMRRHHIAVQPVRLLRTRRSPGQRPDGKAGRPEQERTTQAGGRPPGSPCPPEDKTRADCPQSAEVARKKNRSREEMK
jgi:hypothetical protein